MMMMKGQKTTADPDTKAAVRCCWGGRRGWGGVIV